jgi:hypothetical protein
MTGKNQTSNPFTAEQWELLEQMVAEGKSWTEIGHACGHTANSCSTTYHVRKQQPARKGAHRPWCAEDMARLKHMRGVLHMAFPDIGRELGRTTSACHTKYLVITSGLSPLHGPAEAGNSVKVTPAAIADRNARYQAWLVQSPVAALMGDPLPGRSALDQKRSAQ